MDAGPPPRTPFPPQIHKHSGPDTPWMLENLPGPSYPPKSTYTVAQIPHGCWKTSQDPLTPPNPQTQWPRYPMDAGKPPRTPLLPQIHKHSGPDTPWMLENLPGPPYSPKSTNTVAQIPPGVSGPLCLWIWGSKGVLGGFPASMGYLGHCVCGFGGVRGSWEVFQHPWGIWATVFRDLGG